MKTNPSGVEVLSFYPYYKNPVGEKATQYSKMVTNIVSHFREEDPFFKKLVLRMKEEKFSEFFGVENYLSPFPGRTLKSWPLYKIAKEITKYGLGKGVVTLVRRKTPIALTPSLEISMLPVFMHRFKGESITFILDILESEKELLEILKFMNFHFPDSKVKVFSLFREISEEMEIHSYDGIFSPRIDVFPEIAD